MSKNIDLSELYDKVNTEYYCDMSSSYWLNISFGYDGRNILGIGSSGTMSVSGEFDIEDLVELMELLGLSVEDNK